MRRDLQLRLEGMIVRATLRLPERLAVRLAGAPIVVDDKTLNPNIALLIKAIDASGGRAVEDMALPAGRRVLSHSLAMLGGRLPIAEVSESTIVGPAGNIALRCYVPSVGAAPAPTLVFLHGGGWTYGDLDTYDPVCRFLAEQAGCRVVSVAYRLAPEHPYPAAVEDSWAAWTYVRTHPEMFGADPDRIAIGGDSAGGNLAAVVARRGRDEGLAPAFQLLIYPATDVGPRRRSRELFGEGFVLTNAFMDRCSAAYLPAGADVQDPDLSPLFAADLSGLAPTYLVTAGFDPLLDEGVAYADRLREAGVACEYVCEDGLVHSFCHMVDGGPGREAMARAAAALRRGLR